MLLLEIGLRSHLATVVLLQIGPYCSEGKACEKHRAQLSCCSKLASKHSAQLSLFLKSVTFFRKLNLGKTPCATVLLLEIGVKTLCATVVLLEIGDFCLKAKLSKTPCATVLLLEIGPGLCWSVPLCKAYFASSPISGFGGVKGTACQT